MSEFTIANDLDGAVVAELHAAIVDAIDDWFEEKGIEMHARTVIAALLMDACDITRNAPDDLKADLAEEAVHFIMKNSGADARKVFEAHRERAAQSGSLLAVKPEGTA